jgi:hypothetical protein
MQPGWYLHRLRAMSPSELTHRVVERWKHRSDATFTETLRPIRTGEPAPGIITLPDPTQAPAALKQMLLHDAAALMRGDWTLFGWRKVEVGTPPCWHRDASCGVIIPPDQLSHLLNHRALPDDADARTIWEINRWSEVVRLAMHGYVNEDRKAIHAAIALLDDWCEKNPVGYGINWTSPLEAGLRLINFAWFYTLVDAVEKRPSPGKMHTDRFRHALQRLTQRIVPAHAAWVWRYKSFGSSANNHLLGELVGLLHVVKQWPDLEKQIVSADRLWKEICQCVLDQFATDGGSKEQALHYHLFAWEMMLHAARLMHVTEHPAIDRLQKAAEFFVHLSHENEQWEYGDNDDAQIVPLTLHREDAVAEWRAFMQGTTQGAALRYWFVAPTSGELIETSSPDAGPPGESRSNEPVWWIASESGMAVCERAGWKLRLDASPLGYGSIAAHGHCDALHLSIWDGPIALVIDPGTGGYFGAQKLRAELASWDAHNGPVPSEEGSYLTPVRMGPFLYAKHHARPTLACREGQLIAGFQHEGFAFQREVSVTDRELLVTDSEAQKRPFVTWWKFAPGCEIEQVDSTDNSAFSITRGEKRWLLRIEGERMVYSASGKVSRSYGRLETSNSLLLSATAGHLKLSLSRA